MELFLAITTLVAMSNVFRSMMLNVAKERETRVREILDRRPDLAEMLGMTQENLPSLSAKIENELPQEFFNFMAEYAVQAVVFDVNECNLPADTLTDADKFSTALTDNAAKFINAFLDSQEVREEIMQGFETRMGILNEQPWFFASIPVLQRLRDEPKSED